MPDSDPVPDIIPADADLMSAKLRSLRGSMEVVAAEMLWRERPVVLLCLPHLTTEHSRAEARRVYKLRGDLGGLGFSLACLVVPEPLPSAQEVQEFSPSFWGSASGLYVDEAESFFKALPPYTPPVNGGVHRTDPERRHFSLFSCFGHHGHPEATPLPDTPMEEPELAGLLVMRPLEEVPSFSCTYPLQRGMMSASQILAACASVRPSND